MKEKIGIYPGSFDPLTNGHLDILMRGLELFDTVVIAIGYNIEKEGLFTVEERKDLIRQSVKGNGSIIVDSFQGLLVDFVRRVNARFVIRGLRAMSDFEFEFQTASMNRNLNPDMDTIFMMTGKDYFFVSSRTIKEVASFGGSVSGWVPEVVEKALNKKFKRV
jgi:pantetheine-phosphate adenylyltransferase